MSDLGLIIAGNVPPIFVFDCHLDRFFVGTVVGICYISNVVMAHDTYRQAFDKAKSDLIKAQEREKRAAAEMQDAQADIIQLRRAVTALAVLCGENVEDSIGLTEAVRTVTATSTSWLLSKTIKEQVERLGVSMSDLKNPDASVLSVLNRLTAAGELEQSAGTVQGHKGTVKIWRKKVERVEGEAPMAPAANNDSPL